MGALGIPSAADVERLTRRLRSVSQRLESIEDAVEDVSDQLRDIQAGVGKLDIPAQVGSDPAVAARLDEIARDIAALREAVAPAGGIPSLSQERLSVSDS